jgi:hypothetical protein
MTRFEEVGAVQGVAVGIAYGGEVRVDPEDE